MTFYYQILTTIKSPKPVLTYKSQEELRPGQAVLINVRGRTSQGIVIKQTSPEELEKTGLNLKIIKDISNIYPFGLNKTTLAFLKTFSLNTYNTLPNTLKALLQPFKLLTKKNLSELNFDIQNIQPSQSAEIKKPTESKVGMYLETDIRLRIMYLIRNIIDTKTPSKSQLIVLFPENKTIIQLFPELFTNQNLLAKNLSNQEIFLDLYINSTSKEAKTTLRRLVLEDSPKPQIIFGTRSTIFLPYTNLMSIIVVDESNPFYIQEQNNLYFDTRDASFLLNQAWGANLNFVSTLPSIRLYNSYSKSILDTLASTYTKNTLKPPKIEITARDAKSQKKSLFGSAVEEILGID